MDNLASKGIAILMVSSELPEIIGMSDRVMVIHEGKVAGFLNRNDANEENIMVLATGGLLWKIKIWYNTCRIMALL